MVFFNVFLMLVFLLNHSNFIESKRPFLLLFHEVQCPVYSNLTAYLNCSLTQLDSHESALTVNFKNALKIFEPKMKFVITTRRKGQKTSDQFINLSDVDVCQFFAGQSKFTILRLTQKGLLKVSKLPQECPIEEGFEAYVNNYVFSTENLPLYVPEMHFDVLLRFTEKSIMGFDIFMKGRSILKNNYARRQFSNFQA